ncbi:MAG: DUF1080 domain-containing protein [Gammaproteobacteria bacterium]|jgi:hypothetical protein|nr:DUF1080 domain-containing protein [Gammaproteobacteria bacterium]MDP6733916.1 DUF1080 domain-containing protein [Gammaproteobacteria bacterium]|tara:strand:+ start:959 stop:1555 length:597 start_codon:yes stop_codon:yes gene_type:complete
MKNTINAASILVLLFAFTGASLSYSANNDWVTLIDGTDGMENFNILGNANWSAQMSAIQATEGSGASFLVTKRDYGDFAMRVEFWASDNANSGIFLRCQEPTNINDRNCYEANIFDQRPDPAYGTGGIVHIAAVDEPRPKAGDRWNVYKMTLRGDHLLVELNGKTTVGVRDSQFSSGPFALQWGRGVLRFRKVEVMEL